MNRLLPSLRIERLPTTRREMLADQAGRGIELPQADVKIPESAEEFERRRSNRWRKNQKRSVCKETVAGGLHEPFSPVAEFTFNGCDAEALERQRSKVLSRLGSPPCHEKDVRPAKTIQSEFPTAGVVTFDQLLLLRFQIGSLELRDEIRFAAFRRTRGRKIAPGVVTPEFHGCGLVFWSSHTSGSGAWDGATFCDREKITRFLTTFQTQIPIHPRP